jgi:hypothetical protein
VTNFSFYDLAASEPALDFLYGSGKYTLTYTGPDDGAASVVLALSADSFPPTPVVSNLVAAQAINSASNFTLRFLGRPTANSNDFTQLTIVDSSSNTVFSTPSPDQLPEAALIGANDAIVIKSGALLPGQTYTGTLIYTRLTTNNIYNLTNYPCFMSGFISQTAFPLETESLPPPAAPTGLGNSLLTFTITNSTGAFASNGIYELFTSPLGTNYNILGGAGADFSAGSYLYVQTGPNTGEAILTDSHAGVLSLQLEVGASGVGAFTLSNSTGLQQGVVTVAPAYADLSQPDLFLPGVTNSQFQAYLSGSLGVNYAIDASTDLRTWTPFTNFTLLGLSTNLIDSASARRFYRARVNSVTFAPGAITGQTFNSTIAGGAPPFTNNGIFQFEAGTNGNDYQIIDGAGATNSAGTCTYVVTGPATAAISYTDTSSGLTYSEQLVFTSASSGFFYTSESGSAGFQNGSFNMAAGIVFFAGNVKFTPDTARAASGVFAADGATPLSLSVTDAASNVWSLYIPADALLEPATISMTPFADIDSSQATLPIFSGVRLAPEGMQFMDGVTLTLTPPAPLGQYASLLMGAGDGAGLVFVNTTNVGASYSTTLLHFSSGSATVPSDAAAQNWQNQHLSQLEAAFNDAINDVDNLEKQQTVPPVPPDDQMKCAGNPTADAQVDEYVANLFSEEVAAIKNLISAATMLQTFEGGIQGKADYQTAERLATELIEGEMFHKADLIYQNYHSQPLKIAAYAKAAASVSALDQTFSGQGMTYLNQNLASWLAGNVLQFYWNQLLYQHDYTMLSVLLKIDAQIKLLGGSTDIDYFLQELSRAYTFQVLLAITDKGNNGDPLSIAASGEVNIALDAVNLNACEGVTNNFTYASGTVDGYPLQLPLQFSEGAGLVFGCDTATADLFLYNEVASTNEAYSINGVVQIEDILLEDFDGAFLAENTDGAPGPTFGAFDFKVPWNNRQAQPVINTTFIRPGAWLPDDVVTLRVAVIHAPNHPPSQLTP